MDENATIFRSSDLYFCSYLCALDIPMVATEREPDSRDAGKSKVVFVFKMPPGDIPHIKSAFFGGTGTVKVQKYVQALRSLKSLCFS